MEKFVINPTIIETFLKNTEKKLGEKAGKSKNCIVSSIEKLDTIRFIIGIFTSFSLGVEFSPTSKLDDLLFKIAFLMILATWIKARKTKGAT